MLRVIDDIILAIAYSALGLFFLFLIGVIIAATFGIELRDVLIALFSALCGTAVIIFSNSYLRRKNFRRKNEVLAPHFDYYSYKAATTNFIQTRYQNASPTREEEPGFTHQYVSSSKLIPFFIKNAFRYRKQEERFYLILADSGMGKTTFMINLYMRYISFWNFHRDPFTKIRLFRFGDANTLEIIKNIPYEEAKNTILLLDALDEDPNLFSDTKSMDDQAMSRRIDQIIQTTKAFREVVITCRVQYFTDQESNPYELRLSRPDGKGYYKLNKLYLSPFNDNEIDKYVRKIFPGWKFWTLQYRKKAKTAVKNSPKLMVRPMLLSYIDEIARNNYPTNTVFDIYTILAEKWIEREAEKSVIGALRERYKDNLRKFSEKAALLVFKNFSQGSGLYLNKVDAIKTSAEYEIKLKPNEITGRSLLTCDMKGNWKFAHKSFFEYFLIQYSFEDIKFMKELHKNKFYSFDMAKLFYQEAGSFVFVKGNNKNISDFFIGKTPITQFQWREVMKDQRGYHEGNSRPIENINWLLAIEFCNTLSKKYGLEQCYNRNEDSHYEYVKSANGFRLPEEKEWVYAAEGGETAQKFIYAGSSKIDHVAYYKENSKLESHPVKEKAPNKLGIFDLSGNVWEWCWDEDLSSAQNNTTFHICKGGSFNSSEYECRINSRKSFPRKTISNDIGFRIVLNA